MNDISWAFWVRLWTSVEVQALLVVCGMREKRNHMVYHGSQAGSGSSA